MKKRGAGVALIMALGIFSSAWAGSLNLGVGLGFANSRDTNGLDGGWDLQLGYEMNATEGWNFGTEVHLIRGWTSRSSVNEERENGDSESYLMAFSSEALYLTARPENWWVQFNTGVVHADYHTIPKDASDTGVAVGAGIVLGFGKVQLHVIDYQRYFIGSDQFDVFSLSMAFIF